MDQKFVYSQPRKENQQFKKVQKYELYEQIGKGQYGKVYRSINSETQEQVAIKVVSSQQLQKNQKLKKFAENEVKILTQVNNPYVLKLYDVLHTPNNLYFVYEYCEGGTLDDLLKQHKRLSEDEAISYITQILSGFVSLIQYNILHRDMKPDNIFFKKGIVKIGDFGFCKQLEGREQLTQSQLGSPLYMAPEILFNNDYGLKADIWSIGVIFYELIYGQCPFETNNYNELFNKINNHNLPLSFPENIKVSMNTQHIIQKMLVKDPIKRIQWDALFKYVYTKKLYLLLDENTYLKTLNLYQVHLINKQNRQYLFFAAIRLQYTFQYNDYIIEYIGRQKLLIFYL